MSEQPKNSRIDAGDVQRYSWDWFSYHANQRLAMFRFFLIFLGVLMIAYFNCLKESERLLSTLVALFGVIISAVFLCLDKRNEQLVGLGKDALYVVEDAIAFDKLGESTKLVHRCNELKSWYTHRRLLKVPLCLSIVVFIILAVFPWRSELAFGDVEPALKIQIKDVTSPFIRFTARNGATQSQVARSRDRCGGHSPPYRCRRIPCALAASVALGVLCG